MGTLSPPNANSVRLCICAPALASAIQLAAEKRPELWPDLVIPSAPEVFGISGGGGEFVAMARALGAPEDPVLVEGNLGIPFLSSNKALDVDSKAFKLLMLSKRECKRAHIMVGPIPSSRGLDAAAFPFQVEKAAYTALKVHNILLTISVIASLPIDAVAAGARAVENQPMEQAKLRDVFMDNGGYLSPFLNPTTAGAKPSCVQVLCGVPFGEFRYVKGIKGDKSRSVFVSASREPFAIVRYDPVGEGVEPLSKAKIPFTLEWLPGDVISLSTSTLKTQFGWDGTWDERKTTFVDDNGNECVNDPWSGGQRGAILPEVTILISEALSKKDEVLEKLRASLGALRVEEPTEYCVSGGRSGGTTSQVKEGKTINAQGQGGSKAVGPDKATFLSGGLEDKRLDRALDEGIMRFVLYSVRAPSAENVMALLSDSNKPQNSFAEFGNGGVCYIIKDLHLFLGEASYGYNTRVALISRGGGPATPMVMAKVDLIFRQALSKAAPNERASVVAVSPTAEGVEIWIHVKEHGSIDVLFETMVGGDTNFQMALAPLFSDLVNGTKKLAIHPNLHVVTASADGTKMAYSRTPGELVAFVLFTLAKKTRAKWVNEGNKSAKMELMEIVSTIVDLDSIVVVKDIKAMGKTSAGKLQFALKFIDDSTLALLGERSSTLQCGKLVIQFVPPNFELGWSHYVDHDASDECRNVVRDTLASGELCLYGTFKSQAPASAKKVEAEMAVRNSYSLLGEITDKEETARAKAEKKKATAPVIEVDVDDNRSEFIKRMEAMPTSDLTRDPIEGVIIKTFDRDPNDPFGKKEYATGLLTDIHMQCFYEFRRSASAIQLAEYVVLEEAKLTSQALKSYPFDLGGPDTRGIAAFLETNGLQVAAIPIQLSLATIYQQLVNGGDYNSSTLSETQKQFAFNYATYIYEGFLNVDDLAKTNQVSKVLGAEAKGAKPLEYWVERTAAGDFDQALFSVEVLAGMQYSEYRAGRNGSHLVIIDVTSGVVSFLITPVYTTTNSPAIVFRGGGGEVRPAIEVIGSTTVIIKQGHSYCLAVPTRDSICSFFSAQYRLQRLKANRVSFLKEAALGKKWHEGAIKVRSAHLSGKQPWPQHPTPRRLHAGSVQVDDYNSSTPTSKAIDFQAEEATMEPIDSWGSELDVPGWLGGAQDE